MADAMRDADATHCIDYAALAGILLPGQPYSDTLAPQLLTALQQAVSEIEAVVAEIADNPEASANGDAAGSPHLPPPSPPPPRRSAPFKPALRCIVELKRHYAWLQAMQHPVWRWVTSRGCLLHLRARQMESSVAGMASGRGGP